MVGINDYYTPHKIVTAENEIKSKAILRSFSDYISQPLQDYHYSLYRFCSIRPLMYVDDNSVKVILDFFNSNVNGTLTALESFRNQISKSIFSLIRENPSWSHEESLSLDSPERIIEFESIWHPEYQRYSEHVLNHLIQIPLYILGKAKAKDYNSLTLGSRVEMLRNNSLPNFCEGFNSIVRNSISHGTVYFQQENIHYVDKKADIHLSHFEYSDTFDQLVTTCNSIVSALLLFVGQNWSSVTSFGLEKLPLGLRFLLIDGITSHDGFKAVSMLESTTIAGKKQLNAVCTIRSKSRSIHIYEAVSVSRAIVIFGGKDYDRYFVSLQCGPTVPASIAIDGKHLRDVLSNNTPIEKLPKELFETPLLWYDASTLKSRYYLFSSFFKPRLKKVWMELITDWKDAGLEVLFSLYELRAVENNSSEKEGRINAYVVLKVNDKISDALILRISRHAVRKLRRKRIRRKSISCEFGMPVNPKYVCIRFYSKDERLRTLKSFSWANRELVACSEWISPRSVMDYFYTKDFHLSANRLRTKLNPSLVSE